MDIDVWGLALQAVNVLILIWLLSRVFWRPVAAAIANRQQAATAIIENAHAVQARADAALAEVTQAREGIAAERVALLDAARQEAEAATQSALTEARARAEEILTRARASIERETEAARQANAEQARELALQIASRLLQQLQGREIQAAFVARLKDAIAALPEKDRATLAKDPKGVRVVTASDPEDQRPAIEETLRKALGDQVRLHFVTDPGLVAGIELHGDHFALRNSWQDDLQQVRKVLQDAE
ncbi:ATP synthase F0 subunit B [Paracoccus seriniphilus]|uniref:ATP synthase F0 subunit B n=1 Tax=Paracoccus seriniphilus TaxID=184748 RepID=UPI00356993D4